MRRFVARVHLATVAIAAFVLAFLAARTFTTFFPGHIVESGGLHIHHFWFGIALLAVGGWLGINYQQKDVDVAAAILYGIGGGLIIDEVGLLLTFGDYWSGLTWVILVVVLAVAALLILATRYRKQIKEELKESFGSKLALTLGVFFAALSTAFVLQSGNVIVGAVILGVAVASLITILIFIAVKGRK